MRVFFKIFRFVLPIIFLVIYALTAQRGVAWQDSGIYQWRILYRDFVGVNDLSSAHPGYILLTRFLCGLMSAYMDVDLPFAVNLCSALWMGLALCVFQRIVFSLTRSDFASILATLTFGGAHMVWWLATITEIYPLSLFLLACETLCAVSVLQSKKLGWAFLLLPFFAGLGFAVHNLALLSLPSVVAVMVYAGFIRDSGRGDGSKMYGFFDTVEFLLKYILVWCCGASPVLVLICREYLGGTPIGIVILRTLFGAYGDEVMGLSGVSWKLTMVNLAIASISFLMPAWIIFALDLRKAFAAFRFGWRKRIDVVYIFALFVIHAIFFVRYRIADQALFLLPTLFFATLLASLRFESICRKRLVVALTVASAVLVPVIINGILHIGPIESKILAGRGRLLPYRDELRYWAIPWKHNEYSAELFAENVIEKMDAMPGKKLFADTTSAPPIMLRLSERRELWEFYTPWNDNSGFVSSAKKGEKVFAISPIDGYCPKEALKSGNVLPLFTP